MTFLRVVASNSKELSEFASNLVSSTLNNNEAYHYGLLHLDRPLKSVKTPMLSFTLSEGRQ